MASVLAIPIAFAANCNRPYIPSNRRYPVARQPQPFREYLRRGNECGGVGAEIREEERHRVKHNKSDLVSWLAPMAIWNRQGEQERCHEEKNP